MDQPERWRLDHNHPTRVLEAWKIATGQKEKKEKKETPLEKLAKENKKLAERNDVLEKDAERVNKYRVTSKGPLINLARMLLEGNPGLNDLSKAQLVELGEALADMRFGRGPVIEAKPTKAPASAYALPNGEEVTFVRTVKEVTPTFVAEDRATAAHRQAQRPGGAPRQLENWQQAKQKDQPGCQGKRHGGREPFSKG